MKSRNRVTTFIVVSIFVCFGYILFKSILEKPLMENQEKEITYEDVCNLEKDVLEKMTEMKKMGFSNGIECDSSNINEVKKGDFMCIKESFIRVDSVNAEYIGIYSPKGFFDLLKREVLLVGGTIYKQGTKEWYYAERGILLEETQKLKKRMEGKQKEKKEENKINSRIAGVF